MVRARSLGCLLLLAATTAAAAELELDIEAAVTGSLADGIFGQEFENFTTGSGLTGTVLLPVTRHVAAGVTVGRFRHPVEEHELRLRQVRIIVPGLDVALTEVPFWATVQLGSSRGRLGLWARQGIGLTWYRKRGRREPETEVRGTQSSLSFQVRGGIALALGRGCSLTLGLGAHGGLNRDGEIWPLGRNPRFWSASAGLRLVLAGEPASPAP